MQQHAIYANKRQRAAKYVAMVIRTGLNEHDYYISVGRNPYSLNSVSKGPHKRTMTHPICIYI